MPYHIDTSCSHQNKRSMNENVSIKNKKYYG